MEIQIDWLHWVLLGTLILACIAWKISMNHWQHWMRRSVRERERAEANWDNARMWHKVADERAAELCRLKALLTVSPFNAACADKIIKDDKGPV